MLAVYTANLVLLSALKPAGVVDEHGVHCVYAGERRAADVFFHHSEVGSALEFGWLMQQLAAKNVSSCSCDRPGYGFTSADAPLVRAYRKAPLHVAMSAGAIFALKPKKHWGKRFVLLDPLIGEAINDDWNAYRYWLNRPLDNDRLLVKSGMARLLLIMGLWRGWYGPQPAEAELQLLMSHSEKIRSAMTGDLFELMRNNTKLPALKKQATVDVIFADDKDPAVRVETRRRCKSAMLSAFEENQVEFSVLKGVAHRGLLSHSAVLERILARLKK